ncbi:N(G),N(G)-dimethylarginine dimethylaminohydrolase 1 [Sparganum proliferum]
MVYDHQLNGKHCPTDSELRGSSDSARTIRSHWAHLLMENDLLFFKDNAHNQPRLVVPGSLVLPILDELHRELGLEAYIDQHVHGAPYVAGDLVLRYRPTPPVGTSSKFFHPWEGPFVVIDFLPPSTYTIRDSQSTGGPVLTVHYDKLKPYRGRLPNATADSLFILPSHLVLQPSDEVNLIRQTLKKEMGLTIAELNTEHAQLEGSDVLFTGQEIIVGISVYTNEAGAQSVARAFPEYPTTIVTVEPPLNSLRDAVNMAGVNVIAVGASEAAHKVFKAISEVASNSYKVLHLAEPNAANLLYVNGCLIHYDSDMIPNSTQIFENKIDYTRYPLSLPTLFKHGVPLYKLALLSDRCQVTFTPHSSGLLQ